ncbi:DUF116 domain-containing protein [Desulfothermus okinawensis JCM 13304]
MDDNLYSKLSEKIQNEISVKKRIFISLLLASSAVIVIFLLFFWLIPVIGLSNIHPLAPILLGILVFSIILLVLWSSSSLVLSILFKRPILFSRKTRGLTTKIFLPLMGLVGELVGISKEKVRASFININNEMVLNEGIKYDPDRILMLLPHCLQNSRCKNRLTYNIDNCSRCGKCPIGELLNLRDEYGIRMAIATGGTIARRIVVENRPRFIIAVACERDLASGIQDVYPLPVFGILNIRPCGPCIDTLVSIEKVRWALDKFLKDHGSEKK